MDFPRDFDCVAIRLPIDVQQNGRFAVRADDRIDRFYAGRHAANIANANRNTGGRVLHNCIGDLFRSTNLTIDQPKVELVITLQKAGRIDEIRAPDGIENVGYSDAGS